jgi:hypothetical protein
MSIEVIKDKFLYLKKMEDNIALSELIDIYISTCDNFLKSEKKLSIEKDIELTLNKILIQYDYALVNHSPKKA